MTATWQADEHARATPSSAVVRRRGLIAGAAALIAGIVVAKTTQDVSAANGSNLVIGGDAAGSGAAQTGTAMTWLNTNPAPSGAPTLRVTTAYPNVPIATADGIQGYANGDSLVGVRGRNDATNGYGVRGDAGTGIGTVGVSTSAQGVYGISTSNVGVYGQSASSYAVFGVATGGTGGAAVAGTALNANATAILGTATASGGVAGAFTGPVNVTGAVSITGQVSASIAGTHPVVGTSVTASAGGVLGQTSTTGAYGLFGYTANAAAYAGYFTGRVVVNGDFAVTRAKSAAIRHADGSHRLVYCVEAPESWLEDFGEGRLAGGKVAVALDPEFAALVDMGTLHAFLAPHSAEGGGLAVTKRHATGFGVTERDKGTSDATFSYRVVAKRKDNPGTRLARVELPTRSLQPPEPPTPAKPPPPPKVTPVTPLDAPRKRAEG